ncbi:MAG: YbhB/YbcL family Raf kinase inhibitor-like protein [Candidatus Eisenbacteria bacterium]
MSTLEVRSSSWSQGGAIPVQHTCDGDNISPELNWSEGPTGTQAYALICEDPDAPIRTWYHWVIWNITDRQLPEGVPPVAEVNSDYVQGRNSWSRYGYGGPCPPSGIHRYYFRVYALDSALKALHGASAEQLQEAMKGHVLAQGEIMGTYRRDPGAKRATAER